MLFLYVVDVKCDVFSSCKNTVVFQVIVCYNLIGSVRKQVKSLCEPVAVRRIVLTNLPEAAIGDKPLAQAEKVVCQRAEPEYLQAQTS